MLWQRIRAGTLGRMQIVRGTLNSDMQHEKEPRKLEEGCSWQKRAVVEDPGMAFGDLSGISLILGNHLLYSFSFLFKKK